MGQSTTVEHGLLGVVGNMARTHGFNDAFEAGVGRVQRRGLHSASKKLMQVLLGICAGNKTMIEFQEAGRPIYQDTGLLEAIGFEDGWAENSTLLSFLRRCEDQDVERLREALSSPLRKLLLSNLMRPGAPLQETIVDLDLSGQPTTGEANSFEGTSFGHMAGKLAKGYQLAGAFADVSPSERWMIAARVLPGGASAASSVAQLIADIEQVLGRPMRRADEVAAHLRRREATADELEAKIRQTNAEIASLRHSSQEQVVEVEILRREHATMTPHGRGVARRREIEQAMETHERKRRAVEEGCRRRERRLAKLHSKQTELRSEVAAIRSRLDNLIEDNATNQQPARITIRADSAFGTAEVLNGLYELGYDILMKAKSGGSTESFFRELKSAQWRTVGTKARAVEHRQRYRVATVQYDMRLIGYKRTNVDGRRYRAIIVTTLDPKRFGVRKLVRLFNGRQHIETAYGECKGPFQFGAPRLRKLAANSIFALMVMVAYNLMRSIGQRTTKGLKRRRWKSIAYLVTVLSHARAKIRTSAGHICLTFVKGSMHQGKTIEFCLHHAKNCATP